MTPLGTDRCWSRRRSRRCRRARAVDAQLVAAAGRAVAGPSRRPCRSGRPRHIHPPFDDTGYPGLVVAGCSGRRSPAAPAVEQARADARRRRCRRSGRASARARSPRFDSRRRLDRASLHLLAGEARRARWARRDRRRTRAFGMSGLSVQPTPSASATAQQRRKRTRRQHDDGRCVAPTTLRGTPGSSKPQPHDAAGAIGRHGRRHVQRHPLGIQGQGSRIRRGRRSSRRRRRPPRRRRSRPIAGLVAPAVGELLLQPRLVGDVGLVGETAR